MSGSERDEHWMGLALDLAARGKGVTGPNPCVGAVLVRGGRVIGEGWHQRAGKAHAEIEAMADAHRRGFQIRGATLYVTLEPCCSHGKTPPCTEALIREKIRRVVVAAMDPNPLHRGKGFRILKKAGIEVNSGCRRAEADWLNRDFNWWIQHGTPWVVAKLAMSLDGKITRPEKEGRWLTGETARRKAHELRWEADAILVGAETVRRDNPHLTVRYPGRKGKVQPWRVVVTRSGELPSGSILFTDREKNRTLVFKDKPLSEIFRELGKRGVMNLLIEGGGRIIGEAFRCGAVREVAFFLAPILTGEGTPAFPVSVLGESGRTLELEKIRYEICGPDMLCRGVVKSG